MFQYWWERGSREEQLKIQERRDNFWNEVLKGGVVDPRDRRRDGGKEGANVENLEEKGVRKLKTQ